MLVKDLIKMLEMCNPNYIVTFTTENADDPTGIERAYLIKDILIGNGKEEGIIFLTEKENGRI